jgi:hypothetical protein
VNGLQHRRVIARWAEVGRRSHADRGPRRRRAGPEKIAEQAGCNNHVNALGHENCAGRKRIDRHRLHADLRHVSHDLLDDLVSEGMTAFDHVAENEPKRALHRQFGPRTGRLDIRRPA